MSEIDRADLEWMVDSAKRFAETEVRSYLEAWEEATSFQEAFTPSSVSWVGWSRIEVWTCWMGYGSEACVNACRSGAKTALAYPFHDGWIAV
jgi:hypothetical protein